MSPTPEQLAAPAHRVVQVVVGLVAAAVGALVALIFAVNAREWWLVPASRELPLSTAVIVSCAALNFIWFWGVLAYRLILNRPNSEGGLFSSTLLYGFALFILGASLIVAFAPGEHTERRVHALLTGPAMAGACWIVARRRTRAARVRPF